MTKTLLMAMGAVSLLPLGACTSTDRYGYGPRAGYYDQAPAGNYDAYRHYRHGNNYRERRLAQQDRVYRGSDGRYYCQREDGTTGLIVGALGGGVLGNVIAPGGSELLGTILGAGAGALLGREVDRDDVRCK